MTRVQLMKAVALITLTSGLLATGMALARSQSVAAADPPATKAKAAGDDLQRIQGAWRRVASETGGRDWMPEGSIDPKSPALLVVFKGDKWLGFGVDGKSLMAMHTVALKQTETPKQMLLASADGAKVIFRAAYKIEGDTLTLCIQFDGEKPAPDDFTTKPGDGRVLDVYRRE